MSLILHQKKRMGHAFLKSGFGVCVGSFASHTYPKPSFLLASGAGEAAEQPWARLFLVGVWGICGRFFRPHIPQNPLISPPRGGGQGVGTVANSNIVLELALMSLNWMDTGLVLASNSPRRRELLALGGWHFRVLAADVDETPYPGEAAPAYVVRLAKEKALAAARQIGEPLSSSLSPVTLSSLNAQPFSLTPPSPEGGGDSYPSPLGRWWRPEVAG